MGSWWVAVAWVTGLVLIVAMVVVGLWKANG